MNSSPTITKIAAALVKAQLEMGNAKKESINPFFKKSYADLNSVREAVLPALNANGISVIQPTCVVDGKNYVETIMLHETGEYISSLTEIITDKVNDAQRHGSGLSYARRYALSSIANIGAEDDDANLATNKKAEGVDYDAAIKCALTVKELQQVWMAIPKSEQPKYLAAKDARKKALQPTDQELLNTPAEEGVVK
jgi:ERF superfamily